MSVHDLFRPLRRASTILIVCGGMSFPQLAPQGFRVYARKRWHALFSALSVHAFHLA